MAVPPWTSPVLVLGPAYSGKSRWAKDQLAHCKQVSIFQTGPKTSPWFDPSGQDATTPATWESLETGLDLTATLMERLKPGGHYLVDSLNQWIGRLVFEEGPQGKTHVARRIQDFLTQLANTWNALPTPKPTLFLVSAEVGASPPPYQDHERFFRQSVGIANQSLAQWAQTVITVQAGLASILKAP